MTIKTAADLFRIRRSPVILLRHGIARHPGQEYGSEVFTAPLLPEATKLVLALGKDLAPLQPIRGWNSPIPRCQQTAELLASVWTDCAFEVDSRIKEFSPEDVYESDESVHGRLLAFLEEKILQPSDQVVCICTHGAIVALLKHMLRDGVVSPDDWLDYPPQGHAIVLYPNGTTKEYPQA